MIVRNEEENLETCLAHVAGLFQEIVVVDTGSNDSTREVAARLGAKVFDFPWNDDFSRARNESIRRATGDWIFWLDADDRIDAENARRLGAVFSQLHAVDLGRLPLAIIDCVSYCALSRATICQSHARLFPNNGKLVWEGRIHERLISPAGGLPHLIATDVTIHHLGYEDAKRTAQKQFRDQRILEQDLVLNPDDPMTQFYLGRMRVSQRRPADALRLLQKFIAASHTQPLSNAPHACAMAVKCLDQLQRPAEAIEFSTQSLARFPDDTTILFQHGCLLHATRREREAEACFRRLIAMPRPRMALGGSMLGQQAEEARIMLGHICFAQKRYPEAAAEYRIAAEARPHAADAWYFMGLVCVAAGDRAGLAACLGRIDACSDGKCEGPALRAQAAMTDGQYVEAKRWINKAIEVIPGNSLLHEVLAEILLRQGGDMDECIEAHTRALFLSPGNARLARQLKKLKADQAARLLPAEPAVPVSAPGNLVAAFSGFDSARHIVFTM
jgi:tetratricopeptide (TPR) repeat protein